eukprot:SAG22_NODE_47_length_24699_cov_13.602317_9_plen_392_part_00
MPAPPWQQMMGGPPPGMMKGGPPPPPGHMMMGGPPQHAMMMNRHPRPPPPPWGMGAPAPMGMPPHMHPMPPHMSSGSNNVPLGVPQRREPPAYKPTEDDLYWTVHVCAEKNESLYWYNSKTKESTWKKPPGFVADADGSTCEQLAATPPKPMSWVHLMSAGDEKTPWVVVTTDSGSRFFCNKEQNESYWVMPEEVAELLSRKLKRQFTVEMDGDGGEQEGDGGGSEQDAAAAKKKKKEKEEEEEEDGQDMPKHVAHSVLAAAKELKSADDEYRAKIEGFKQMLDDCAVAAFSSWEKELPKFIADPRYKTLMMVQRRATFDGYVKTKAEKERKEKLAQRKTAIEDFRAMLLGEHDKLAVTLIRISRRDPCWFGACVSDSRRSGAACAVLVQK